MKIEKMVLGALRTNCFLLINEQTKETVIIDPCDQADDIKSLIHQQGLKPVGILLTHGHFDHILAVDELRDHYGLKVYAHQEEANLLQDSNLNLSAMFGAAFSTMADELVADEEMISLAGLEIRCIHTPGHTRGGVCYYIADENVVISGDTLFCESYGRIDFPTGNGSELVASIREKLFHLPEQTKVCPGHEGETTIAHEKMYNPI